MPEPSKAQVDAMREWLDEVDDNPPAGSWTAASESMVLHAIEDLW